MSRAGCSARRVGSLSARGADGKMPRGGYATRTSGGSSYSGAPASKVFGAGSAATLNLRQQPAAELQFWKEPTTVGQLRQGAITPQTGRSLLLVNAATLAFEEQRAKPGLVKVPVAYRSCVDMNET